MTDGVKNEQFSQLESESASRVRVLAAEDDKVLGILLTRYMQRRVGVFDLVNNPYMALTRLKEDPDRYNVLMTDFDMPGMNGGELAVKAREQKPGLVTVLFSGRAKEDLPEDFPQEAIDIFVQKPMNLEKTDVLVEKMKGKL